MNSIWINIISVLVLIISYYMFKYASGTMSFRRLNMISFIFYIDLFLLSFIGCILIVNNIDNHYIINKLNDQNNRFYGWMAVMYVMLMLPLGIIIAQKIMLIGSAKQVFNYFTERKLNTLISLKDSYVKMTLYLLSFISILSVIYIFICIKTIPVVELIRGEDPDYLAKLRILASRDFPGNSYIKNIFGLLLPQILTFTAYGYYKISKSNLDMLWFISMLFTSIMVLTYDLEKSPLFFFLLGFLFFKVAVDGKIKVRSLFAFSALIFTGLLVFYILLSDLDLESVLFSYNHGIPGRIFLTQISNMYLFFDTFPQNHEFLGLSSLSRVFTYLFDTESQETAARIVMEIYNKEAVKAGTGGVMNTLFVGEAWANFGLIGVLVSPLYVGIIVGILYYILIKVTKTPLILAVYVFFCYKSSITGGFNTYLYSGVYLSLFIIIVFIIAFSKYLKLTSRNE